MGAHCWLLVLIYGSQFIRHSRHDSASDDSGVYDKSLNSVNYISERRFAVALTLATLSKVINTASAAKNASGNVIRRIAPVEPVNKYVREMHQANLLSSRDRSYHCDEYVSETGELTWER